MSRVNTTGRMLSFGLGCAARRHPRRRGGRGGRSAGGMLAGTAVAGARLSATPGSRRCVATGAQSRRSVAGAQRLSRETSVGRTRHRSLSSHLPHRGDRVLLRMSTLFLRTLREDPADAEVPSHRLLVRAGYIRRAAPGGYTWLPLGWRVLRNVERDRPRGDGRAWARRRCTSRRCCPGSPTSRAAAGPSTATSIFRLKDRKGADYLLGPDPRGDVHPAGEGPLLVVQGPAAVDLPDPDEVPRRGAAPGRAAARPRVRHEGLLLLRRRRRRASTRPTPRTARPTSGSSTGSGSTTSSSRRCPARWAARSSEEFLTPADVGEDTYVRCTTCDYAANVEARAHPGARPPRRTTACPAAHVEDTPDTPTIETLVALANARDDLRRADRDWTAADTLKNVVVKLRHPDGKTELLAIGVPGDREVDAKRLEAVVAPGRGRAVHRGGLRRQPGAGPRLHRSGRARRRQAGRGALPARPAGRRGHPLDHRRQRAGPARLRPGRRPRLHRRRHDRGGRGARGRPVPQ